MSRLARCNMTGGIFDEGEVEVTARYADCSVFKCPSCGQTHDDRPAWGGPTERRMGYTRVRNRTSLWGVTLTGEES